MIRFWIIHQSYQCLYNLFCLSKLLCQICPERMIRFWIIHQSYQCLYNLFCLSSWFPVLSRDDGKAHLTLLVNVWVVDLGPEANLWWLEWIFGGEYQIYQESSLVIRCLVRNRQALPHQQITLVHLHISK